MKYARPINNHKEYHEEYGYHYLSKDFRLRTFTGMDHKNFATVFWQDYIFPDFTFEKMREFANYLEACSVGIWDENLTFVVLECMQLTAVKEGLECTIFVLDAKKKEEAKMFLLSRVECFSIAKNINHQLDDFSTQEKTLMIDLSEHHR